MIKIAFDENDQEILKRRIAIRDAIDGPRLGDYVLFQNGKLERFSNDLGDALQTSPSGSFYLSCSGWSQFSGGLNPSTPKNKLVLSSAILPGEFWFFHHDQRKPGGTIYFQINCRAFTTTARYEGYLGNEFRSDGIEALKNSLKEQLAAHSSLVRPNLLYEFPT